MHGDWEITNVLVIHSNRHADLATFGGLSHPNAINIVPKLELSGVASKVINQQQPSNTTDLSTIT
jgi:hypothetical protein